MRRMTQVLGAEEISGAIDRALRVSSGKRDKEKMKNALHLFDRWIRLQNVISEKTGIQLQAKYGSWRIFLNRHKIASPEDDLYSILDAIRIYVYREYIE